ncbi:DUF6391 domain-containing protein [Aminobacterium mobile]|jgi:hypothetical protein|uniref:DUF6391 domain-containing protein n=1 Tax=Aminobacterium mobile TaxID=81467 RepID=UPI00046447A3|nr:DUF6391 domain-containing protein [Aminobacterium mobile]
MPFILLLLLFFIAPWAGFIALLLFVIFFLVFIPLGFAASSFIWLIAGPTQLFKVLFNKKVRKNHGLEHGTIHVLEESLGRCNIEGMAYDDGFSLRGLVDPASALYAARVALERMKRGESSLAVHPRCGTTIVVINTLSSLLFIVLLLATGTMGLLNVIVALLLSHLLGPALSTVVQRYVTTDSDVEDIEITGVEVRAVNTGWGGFSVYGPSQLFIRTRRKSEAIQPEVLFP